MGILLATIIVGLVVLISIVFIVGLTVCILERLLKYRRDKHE